LTEIAARKSAKLPFPEFLRSVQVHKRTHIILKKYIYIICVNLAEIVFYLTK
jgi:hypothetical protein